MRYILAAWDSTGFETLQDITHFHPENFEKTQLIEILSGHTKSKNPLGQQISMMKLRAQANMQRVYEIYIFSTNDDIEFKDVEDWMIGDPQSLVNWVRTNHTVKIYSDYVPEHRRAIV
jgi:hypothetical protein